MFNDILGKKRKKLPIMKGVLINVQPMTIPEGLDSDNRELTRRILELDHKSNSELLDMYFLWRQAYENPKLQNGWNESIKEDMDLIEEEIFNR